MGCEKVVGRNQRMNLTTRGMERTRRRRKRRRIRRKRFFFFGFLTSSSTTRLYRGRAQR